MDMPMGRQRQIKIKTLGGCDGGTGEESSCKEGAVQRGRRMSLETRPRTERSEGKESSCLQLGIAQDSKKDEGRLQKKKFVPCDAEAAGRDVDLLRYMSVCVCVCERVCVYVCMCIHVCMCMCICVYVYVYVCM